MSESRVAASYVKLLYEYLDAQGLDAVASLGPAPAAGQHFVSMSTWKRMLEQAARIDPRPALGLRIAQGISARHFGVVGYAALSCATLGDVLMRMERYHASVYDANLAKISSTPSGIQIEWGVERGRPGALVDETGIASLVQLARDFTGGYWPVPLVCFVNPQPDDVRPYQNFFGGDVLFEQAATRLQLPWSHLNLPLRKSDPALLALLDSQAEALLKEVTSVSEVVEGWRRSLVSLIREGQTSLAALAEAHHLSPRTMQRKLAEQGTNFQRLLDETRKHLADGYLRDPTLELAEIALLLGYSEQSAFTRAFKVWSGVAPAQWRKTLREPESGDAGMSSLH